MTRSPRRRTAGRGRRQRHERAVHPPADRHQLARARVALARVHDARVAVAEVDVAVDHKADKRGSLLIFVLDVELRPSNRLVVVVLVTARVLARRLVAAPLRARARAFQPRAGAHSDRGDREHAEQR